MFIKEKFKELLINIFNFANSKIPQKLKSKKQELIVNTKTLEMIYVKGGWFRMGSDEDEKSQPIHTRKVADFYIGKYPVSIENYMDFVIETKSNFPEWSPKIKQYNLKTDTYKLYKGFTNDTQPIVGISWYNAVEYCKWLSKKTKKEIRLPSEVEWEYAAGGGSQNRTKYAGTNSESNLKDYAWYWKNSGDKKFDEDWESEITEGNNCRTHDVGQKKSNQLGIHDMSGNIWEWCQDKWSSQYKNADSKGKAYEGGDSCYRVLRGGAWNNTYRGCRIRYRGKRNPKFCGVDNGFRIASNFLY